MFSALVCLLYRLEKVLSLWQSSFEGSCQAPLLNWVETLLKSGNTAGTLQMACSTGMREKNKICGVTRVGQHGHAIPLWRLALLGFFQRTIGSILFQDGITSLIQERRSRSVQAINRELIDLYWEIGKRLSLNVENAGWGKAIIDRLAIFLKTNEPNLKGFSASNLWRMKQFYETYHENEKLAPLVREIPWSSNLFILSKAKFAEEREFEQKWKK